MKAVLDTNVFVSSFFGGNPRKIISLWQNGDIEWCLSAPIMDEYTEVLKRLGLAETEELADFLTLFAEGRNILFTVGSLRLHIIADDPDDNKFIECAVALKAACIVSGDRHLTAIRNYMGIPILAPEAFLSYYQTPKS